MCYIHILYHVVQYKILKPAQQRVLGLKGQYLKWKSKAKQKFPAQIRKILHGQCNKSMHNYSLEKHIIFAFSSTVLSKKIYNYIAWWMVAMKNVNKFKYTVQILYRKQCKLFEICMKKVKDCLHIHVAVAK